MGQDNKQEEKFTDYSGGESRERKILNEIEVSREQFIRKKVDQIKALLENDHEWEEWKIERTGIIRDIIETLHKET